MSQSRSEQTQNISRKRQNSLSLQTRLVLFVLFAALVPLTIISVRDTVQTQQALINGAEISLKSSAAQTANSLDNFIQRTLDSIGAEAQLADFAAYLVLPADARTESVVRARTLDLLQNLSKKDTTNIISYALVDANGNVLLDSVDGPQKNESDEVYFQQAQFSQNPIVSYVTYEEDKTTSITFASAVTNNNGSYIGVLRVKFKSVVLQDVIIKSVGPSTDVSVLLLDQLSIRMADSQNPELILKSIVPLKPVDYSIAVNNHRFLDIPAEEQATNYPDFELALDNALNQPFFRADITPDVEGDDTIAVAFLQTQPWIVTYSRPTSIFLADVQKQIRTNIILVISTLIITAIITTLIARSLTNPITALAKVANLITQGDLNARAKSNTTDEIGVLASAFNSMTERLQENLANLEERVVERTDELQTANKINAHRARQFEAISQVSHAINQTRSLQDLLPQITRMISQQFNFYHVGIFLLDTNIEYAVLVAANSEGGQKMLARDHKLKIGQVGIVGNVAGTGAPRIALDTGADAIYFNNPDLPETRSEMALPLYRTGQGLIGVLDVQSTQPNAFGQDDIQILTTLADQVSIAIANARLYEETQKALLESEMLYRRNIQTGWSKFTRSQKLAGIRRRGMKSNLLTEPIELPGALEVTQSGNIYQMRADKNHESGQMTIPMKLRGEVVGVLNVKTDGDRVWSADEMDIITAILERAALSIENARLLDESQKRAAKERTIGDISAKIGSLVNIENILQTTIQELGNTMPNTDITIQFKKDQETE